MSASEISLPPNERADIAHSLLQSLPGAPKRYETEKELVAELNRRMERIENGQETFFDGEETLRRARQALDRQACPIAAGRHQFCR